MPELTIVIPTHNRQGMLDKAIKSATTQTFSKLEVIVVDDGSDVPISNKMSDPRVSIHRHALPRGASAARNTGLSLAKGIYIAFLDDDDTLCPEYGEKMLRFMKDSEPYIDFSWSTLSVINIPSGKRSRARVQPCYIRRGHPASESSYAAAAYVGTTGMMFKTSSIRAFEGFDESLAVSEDRELIFRMLSNGCGCRSLDTPLVNFFIHNGPRLSTHENLIQQANCDAKVAERHSEFIAQHPKLASRYLNLLARRQKDAGLIPQYRTTLKKLLKINPMDIRALKRLVLSFISA